MPRRLVVLVALLGVLATGCQVDLVAGVDVGRDGRGRVSAGLGLDADALKELGDPATALRVEDLRQAGWEVAGPRREADGLTWVRASKGFADADEANAVVAQLTGPNGPFRDFRVTRKKSLLRSRTEFTGVLDLATGLAGLSDPELADRLGDVSLGLDLDGLKRRFGDDLAGTVKVQVTAGLPGNVTTNAPARAGARAVWSPELGQTVPLRASSEALNHGTIVALVAGGAAVLLALVVAGLLVVRRRRNHRAVPPRR